MPLLICGALGEVLERPDTNAYKEQKLSTVKIEPPSRPRAWPVTSAIDDLICLAGCALRSPRARGRRGLVAPLSLRGLAQNTSRPPLRVRTPVPAPVSDMLGTGDRTA
jgi:hypothetical protein